MATTSLIYTSPSFNTHSSNNIADIADRVVQELLSETRFHDGDDFTFTDDDNNPPEIAHEVKPNPITVTDEDENEFEFPVVCLDSGDQIATESVSDDHISTRYPLFDRSLLTHVDLNLRNGVDAPSPSPAMLSSLMKLFTEDRDTASISTSNSTSSSEAEAEELDGISPETYCVWTPKTAPPRGKHMTSKTDPPRGKHKKSNSISVGNTSNRWKMRDLLKRSYSDDNYSIGKESPVLFFIPPVSAEKGNKIGSGKTEKKLPACKSKMGNIRLPPYLPYRQDQLAAYANFNGLNNNNNHNNNIYRY